MQAIPIIGGLFAAAFTPAEYIIGGGAAAGATIGTAQAVSRRATGSEPDDAAIPRDAMIGTGLGGAYVWWRRRAKAKAWGAVDDLAKAVTPDVQRARKWAQRRAYDQFTKRGVPAQLTQAAAKTFGAGGFGGTPAEVKPLLPPRFEEYENRMGLFEETTHTFDTGGGVDLDPAREAPTENKPPARAWRRDPAREFNRSRFEGAWRRGDTAWGGMSGWAPGPLIAPEESTPLLGNAETPLNQTLAEARTELASRLRAFPINTESVAAQTRALALRVRGTGDYSRADVKYQRIAQSAAEAQAGIGAEGVAMPRPRWDAYGSRARYSRVGEYRAWEGPRYSSSFGAGEYRAGEGPAQLVTPRTRALEEPMWSDGSIGPAYEALGEPGYEARFAAATRNAARATASFRQATVDWQQNTRLYKAADDALMKATIKAEEMIGEKAVANAAKGLKVLGKVGAPAAMVGVDQYFILDRYNQGITTDKGLVMDEEKSFISIAGGIGATALVGLAVGGPVGFVAGLGAGVGTTMGISSLLDDLFPSDTKSQWHASPIEWTSPELEAYNKARLDYTSANAILNAAHNRDRQRQRAANPTQRWLMQHPYSSEAQLAGLQAAGAPPSAVAMSLAQTLMSERQRTSIGASGRDAGKSAADFTTFFGYDLFGDATNQGQEWVDGVMSGELDRTAGGASFTDIFNNMMYAGSHGGNNPMESAAYWAQQLYREGSMDNEAYHEAIRAGLMAHLQKHVHGEHYFANETDLARLIQNGTTENGTSLLEGLTAMRDVESAAGTAEGGTGNYQQQLASLTDLSIRSALANAPAETHEMPTPPPTEDVPFDQYHADLMPLPELLDDIISHRG